jgi:hypothetical protein
MRNWNSIGLVNVNVPFGFYRTYEEQRISPTQKPADFFQRVLSPTQRLAIRRFFFFIRLFLSSRSDAMSGCLGMLRMAAE